MPGLFRRLPSGKIIYFSLCAVALAGNVYLFFLDTAPHAYGRDFNIYVSAVRVHDSGGNPYAPAELASQSGDFLAFTSSPVTLPVFTILDKLAKPFGYWVLYLLFLALSFFVVVKSFSNNDLLYLAVLLLSGFWASYLNLMTGNIELLMLLVFSAACFFYVRNRLPAFYLSIGALAVFKVAPALFGLPPFLIGGEKRLKVRAALMFFAVLAALNGLSLALYGRAHIAWLKQLFGQGAIRDAAGGSGVSFFALAYRLLLAEDRDPLFFAGLLHAVFSAVCVLGFIIFKRRVVDRNAVFFFGVLAALLVMPRLRDYSFVY
ncbi:MAG: DUF2029 domain-containing protein, partial [Candidatus Aminicenantes bacterium]|nr:DUF2029 domain-containing protein [Candidatus Aminicenantes bacterium]